MTIFLYLNKLYSKNISDRFILHLFFVPDKTLKTICGLQIDNQKVFYTPGPRIK